MKESTSGQHVKLETRTRARTDTLGGQGRYHVVTSAGEIGQPGLRLSRVVKIPACWVFSLTVQFECVVRNCKCPRMPMQAHLCMIPPTTWLVLNLGVLVHSRTIDTAWAFPLVLFGAECLFMSQITTNTIISILTKLDMLAWGALFHGDSSQLALDISLFDSAVSQEFYRESLEELAYVW